MTTNTASDRRNELLDIAANLFADRGLKATTVRDIADAAGILSGSLYHHFDSKESMVDEILRSFLDELFGDYDVILAQQLPPRERFEAIVTASFKALDRHHAAVAIYQNEAGRLVELPKFRYIRKRLTQFRTMWTDLLREGIADGSFRKNLDLDLAYRFFRDTVWVSVRWYRPGGRTPVLDVTKQYLSIVLDGIGSS